MAIWFHHCVVVVFQLLVGSHILRQFQFSGNGRGNDIDGGSGSDDGGGKKSD